MEWILTNTRCNGNVGVKGTSYPGFYATMAALSRHPAIKAVSPQAPVTDWFMGDDAHHNGALCLADCYRFGSSMYRTRKAPSTKGLSKLVKIDTDLYDYFRGKPMSGLSDFFGDTLTFWNSMVAHPDYDNFWKDRNPARLLKDIKPAVLVTGGFYDAEDCYGAFKPTMRSRGCLLTVIFTLRQDLGITELEQPQGEPSGRGMVRRRVWSLLSGQY